MPDSWPLGCPQRSDSCRQRRASYCNKCMNSWQQCLTVSNSFNQLPPLSVTCLKCLKIAIIVRYNCCQIIVKQLPQLSNCCTQYQTIISIASQLQQQPLSLGCHNYQFRDILQKMAHACLAKFTMSSLYDNILRQVWQSKQSQYCTVYSKVYNTVHFTCTVHCTVQCTLYCTPYCTRYWPVPAPCRVTPRWRPSSGSRGCSAGHAAAAAAVAACHKLR